MKTQKTSTYLILGILLIVFFWGCGSYNGLIDSDLNVKNVWSRVEGQYQRRADLFKNIISNIKASGKFEDSVLTKVVRARYEFDNIKLDPQDPSSIDAKYKALNGMQSGLKVVFENYPQLQTTKLFQDFQTEISGTENRVNIARKDYSDAVTSYNSKILRFPGNLLAKLFSFKEKPFYKADPGTDKAPDVDKLYNN